jgi:hypothetical protein
MSFARAAALLAPAHPAQAMVIFQELLNAIRQVKYYKPKDEVGRGLKPPRSKLRGIKRKISS